MEKALITHNKHWKKPYDGLYQRSVYLKLIDLISLKQIQVLKGIRRSGKTTLFRLLINHLSETVDPRSILYVNLDDPYFSDLYNSSKSLYSLLELSEKVTGIPVQYLFLDEVQNVDAWEKFVKAIYDNEVVKKIFVTGSNSSLLEGEYAKLLSGRYIETEIHAPTFSEVLNVRGIKSRFELIDRKAEALRLVDEMMEFGSFFEVLDAQEHKRDIILSYYDTIVFKDCIANNNLRDAKTFKEVAHFMITNSASLYSYTSVSKALGVNDGTVKEYIHVLEDSYICQEIKQYAFSLKEQIRSKKKVYINDNGFLSQTSFKFSQNYGQTFENLVYTEFNKRGYEVYFHNKDFECDFICKKGEQLLAVQVCYELTPQNRPREFSGLEKLKLKTGRKLLVTYNQSEGVADGVEVIAFWDLFSEEITS
ncbi:ATP-binding protein [Leucothrix pacifica]|uniref:AAA family ATPase n=1 Tax=Leucothrix pacifica TaxID=1247513 RepID=A0A317CSK1_9GAMM|nr:ATP-binding protein [Leucothrix pacifica]PWQ99302.1 AAA family ATPase [Leucothrix pacifica]